jgi:hypothetical protein
MSGRTIVDSFTPPFLSLIPSKKMRLGGALSLIKMRVPLNQIKVSAWGERERERAQILALIAYF